MKMTIFFLKTKNTSYLISLSWHVFLSICTDTFCTLRLMQSVVALYQVGKYNSNYTVRRREQWVRLKLGWWLKSWMAIASRTWCRKQTSRRKEEEKKKMEFSRLFWRNNGSVGAGLPRSMTSLFPTFRFSPLLDSLFFSLLFFSDWRVFARIILTLA